MTTSLTPRQKNNTAASHMVPNVPLCGPGDTIGYVEDLLEQHAASFATINYIYIVDGRHRLVGVVSIKEIFSKGREVLLGTIARKDVVTVPMSALREHVALVSIEAGIKAVPVVDDAGSFVGVVTASTIIQILHQKSIEDSLRFAGSGSFANPTESILSGSALLHARKRLPWLLVGLFGGILAAMIVRSFEAALATQVLVAAFIPTIVYMADAVGSQTEMIFVRALALEHRFRFWAYFRREALVNTMLGIILGGLMTLGSVFMSVPTDLAVVLGLSIFLTVVMSMLIALCIPYLSLKLGYDPAVSSGPLATIVRDLLSLLVYLSVVTVFL